MNKVCCFPDRVFDCVLLWQLVAEEVAGMQFNL
jgi:hypothetical protein